MLIEALFVFLSIGGDASKPDGKIRPVEGGTGKVGDHSLFVRSATRTPRYLGCNFDAEVSVAEFRREPAVQHVAGFAKPMKVVPGTRSCEKQGDRRGERRLADLVGAVEDD